VSGPVDSFYTAKARRYLKRASILTIVNRIILLYDNLIHSGETLVQSWVSI
jgi:hypothetical protein